MADKVKSKTANITARCRVGSCRAVFLAPRPLPSYICPSCAAAEAPPAPPAPRRSRADDE